MVKLVSVPSVSSSIGLASTPVSTPAPSPRPARLLRNVLSLITKHCESPVPQLFPYPDLSYLPEPDMGIFINSEITDVGQAMLRQARDLSIRLEVDGRYCGDFPDILTPELLQTLLEDTLSSSADARRRLALTNSQLSQLNEVATLAFDAFLLTAPTALLHTDLNAQTMRTLLMAGVDTTGCSDPGKLYRALCVRLIALERSAMTLSLECLKFDLQVQRLRMLRIAGRFLSAQAMRILDDEFESSDEFPGMHFSELALTACAASPFDAEWPTPRFDPEECKFLRERTGAGRK